MQKQTTILFICDDKVICNLYPPLFERDGHQVTVTTVGNHVLVTAITVKPDIIILVQNTPDDDGYKLITKLRNNPKCNHIPITMVCGEMTHDIEKKAISLGCNKVLDIKYELTTSLI